MTNWIAIESGSAFSLAYLEFNPNGFSHALAMTYNIVQVISSVSGLCIGIMYLIHQTSQEQISAYLSMFVRF